MEENKTTFNNEIEAQLSAILEADDDTLNFMLNSGQIGAIVDNLYAPSTIREQLREFRDDGLSKEQVWEQVQEYEESLNDLMETLKAMEGAESPRVKVLVELLTPIGTFLRKVYDLYTEGDCQLKVELLEGAQIPTRAHKADAGMDVYSAVEQLLDPGTIYAIGTGLKVAIPVGWQLSVRPRSGLSMKDLTVVNSPGTIDANYHDEIKILMKNNGTEPYQINKGDRIAQFVLEKVYTVEWEQVDNLEEVISESRVNEKGEQGFGSTGR